MDSAKTIKPTAICDAFGGQVRIEYYGVETGNWSLKGIMSSQDVTSVHAQDVLARLGILAKQTDVSGIYAPTVSPFNHKICSLADFTTKIPLPGSDATLLRGINAEGTFVPFEAATFITAADCAVIVAKGNGKTIVAAHACRDSLMPTGKVWDTECESIIPALVTSLESTPDPMRVFICQGINGEHFRHNISDANNPNRFYNLKLLEYLQNRWPQCIRIEDGNLCIYLTPLIKWQLQQLGMAEEDIATDGCCTYCDKGGDGKPLWWSHQRWWDNKMDTADGRNGYLIYRRW